MNGCKGERVCRGVISPRTVLIKALVERNSNRLKVVAQRLQLCIRAYTYERTRERLRGIYTYVYSTKLNTICFVLFVIMITYICSKTIQDKR